VMGAPSTNRHMLAWLERGMPMRSNREPRDGKNDINTFTIADPPAAKPRHEADQIQEEENFQDEYVDLTKWAIVTRRWERSHSDPSMERAVTGFSGHSRCVEAVINHLTSDATAAEVLERFGGTFPKAFQIFFRVDMTKHWGDLIKNVATPEITIPITPA
jgi:hypothetical protein